MRLTSLHARRPVEGESGGGRWQRIAGRITATLAAAALCAAAWVQPAGAAPAQARPSYVTAAEYFAQGSALNLWSTNMSNAGQVFARMKHDGFNAVALVVPWGQFQPRLTPPSYDSGAFARLDRLIRLAKSLDMGVVLRLSYEWDVNPADQLPWGQRFDRMWTNGPVYQAWLDYISAIHRNIAPYHNVWEAYISWEDLWEPAFSGQAATTRAAQLSLAASTGYRAWLRAHYSLAQVSSQYGTTFAKWSQVGTPPADRPSWALMLDYQDWALIHHLFIPASKRFPGLTMETRVDVDPIYNGTQVVGSFPHTDLFQLPGTSVTGMYLSPYMGDPSPSMAETSADALSAMQTTLSTVSSQSGGRRLFIYEYEFESNSAAVASDPSLVTDQIPAYLSGSVPLLKKYTTGYALWTYQDYNMSTLYNPSFSLGSAGWKLGKGAHVGKGPGGSGAVVLGSGASITQKLYEGPSTSASTFSIEAEAPAPTVLDVQVGNSPVQQIQVQGGWHTYEVSVPGSSVASLSLKAAGPLSATNAQLYSATQLGDVYSLSGAPEVGAAAVRALNQQLTS